MKEKDLFKLKERIDGAKTEIAEMDGQLKYLMKELKEKWGCSTLKEAKKLIAEMEGKLDDYDNKIAEGLEEIEEEYADAL